MTATAPHHSAAPAVPQFALAGVFLEGLAAQDFARLGGALAADAQLRALVPAGLREWNGAEAIAGQFARWFGDTEDFELVEATVGEVAGRRSEEHTSELQSHVNLVCRLLLDK